jgi:CRISPR-associated protein Cmr3
MIIEISALDTLFFRDGKPFEMGDDTWANGIFPPLPSVFYGALRSAYASEHKTNFSDIESETKSLLIKKIYLAIGNDLFFPMPLDYVELKGKENEGKVKHLNIVESNQFTSSYNLPYASFSKDEVKQINEGIFDKDQFEYYIQGDFSDCKVQKYTTFSTTENKIGIGREDTTHIAKDSKIYRVAMRRMENKEGKKLKFVIEYEFEDKEETKQNISEFVRIGGEGKAAKINSFNVNSFESPQPTKYFKILLLTPAIFDNGDTPNYKTFFDKEKYNVELINAIVGKPFRVGGFDIKNKQPKEMKTAVPAGSVYYFKINTDKTALDIYNDLKDIHSISEYKKKEGFGLYQICSLDLESLITKID